MTLLVWAFISEIACNGDEPRQSLPSAEGGVTLTMLYSNMALLGQFIDAGVSDKDWYIWCFSPIMGDDGKVHAFCSRWSAFEGMDGWIGENAEIAHYVSEKPRDHSSMFLQL